MLIMDSTKGKKYYLFFISILIGFLFSCQKDEVIIPEDFKARNELYEIMNEWYYWYDKMPEVDKNLYDTPAELLEAMRYLPDDHYSFVAPREYIENTLEGKYIGYGFAHIKDSEGIDRILYVYKDSPFYSHGIRRSYIITKINGVILNENSNLSDLLGPAEIGVSNTFEFLSPSDSTIEITAEKKEIHKNSIIYYDTIQVNSKTVGHMVFDEFIEPSYDEFDETFTFFLSAGIEEMVMDLRYNPGGLTDVMARLASLITGTDTDGKVLIEYEHNDKKTDYNSEVLFQQRSNSVNLGSIIFITSGGTASSSEALINSLKPYIDVTVIGQSTYGKPVGMYVFKYGDWAFLPIVFKITNANNEGDYFNGIPPDFICADDVTRQFHDPEESCLKEAIYYIKNGGFSGTKHGRIIPVTEKPEYRELLRRSYLK